MKSPKGKTRALARLIVMSALGTSATSGCADVTPPKPHHDAWADAAVIGVQVRSQLRVFDKGTVVREQSATDQVKVPVLYGTGWRLPSKGDEAYSRTQSHRTSVRHFRDRSGKTLSLGLSFDRPDAPPSFIYLFENGRIKSIVSPVYQKHGKGFVRVRSRITLFGEDGTPQAQVDLSPRETATAGPLPGRSKFHAKAAEAVKDVGRLFLPQPLHAAEGEEACFSEWVVYAAASGILGSASAAVTAEIAACAGGAAIACAAIERTIVIWLAAMVAWNTALDRLVACRELGANDAPVTGGNTGGSGGGSGGGGGMSPDSGRSLTNTVNQFIRTAIGAGNYWCSSDGSYCVFTSSQV